MTQHSGQGPISKEVSTLRAERGALWVALRNLVDQRDSLGRGGSFELTDQLYCEARNVLADIDPSTR
ncbi:hypothetical protein LCGC14_1528710 [marine sediment metagenome]|uniref:Uncharacterized protein n=1 Tax=marine sediment metagenome TaxID=412755 RepID=A0A0F9LXD7_9ZZZZ